VYSTCNICSLMPSGTLTSHANASEMCCPFNHRGCSRIDTVGAEKCCWGTKLHPTSFIMGGPSVTVMHAFSSGVPALVVPCLSPDDVFNAPSEWGRYDMELGKLGPAVQVLQCVSKLVTYLPVIVGVNQVQAQELRYCTF